MGATNTIIRQFSRIPLGCGPLCLREGPGVIVGVNKYALHPLPQLSHLNVT